MASEHSAGAGVHSQRISEVQWANQQQNGSAREMYKPHHLTVTRHRTNMRPAIISTLCCILIGPIAIYHANKARVLQKRGHWYESQQRANWACRAAIISAVIGSIVNVSVVIAIVFITDYRT